MAFEKMFYLRMALKLYSPWRRLVKNIGRANQNIGGWQKVVKVINAWAFINYWGARARAVPPSLRL